MAVDVLKEIYALSRDMNQHAIKTGHILSNPHPSVDTERYEAAQKHYDYCAMQLIELAQRIERKGARLY